MLGTARRRDPFLKILEEARRRYRFVVAGYVVMPEHFHLLISEPEEADPSVVMKVSRDKGGARGPDIRAFCECLGIPEHSVLTRRFPQILGDSRYRLWKSSARQCNQDSGEALVCLETEIDL